MTRAFLLFTLAAAACSRPPSPEYSAARGKHAAIVAAHPADAAARAEMDEVLATLERVPEKSVDSPAARELRDRILAERKALQEEESRRASLVARAGEAPSWPAATSIGRPPPRPAPIAPGMRLEDFRGAHGSCFERSGEVELTAADGKSTPAEAWALKAADADCATRYGAQRDQLVIVANGAVVGVRPASDAKVVAREQAVRREEWRDVELVRMADGRWGIKGADGKVEPVPEGAQVRTRDGAPLPGPEQKP